jgi:saccharopine dehydrogenase-like NADP-dependent oxidoreductase
LVQYSDFDEIVIADYNVKAADALVKELGDSRLKTIFFDADNYEMMLRLLPGYDVVINGLPWKYDLAVTKACVEVGVNGLDVSTEEEQWDFHDIAKEKDIVFIPGVGATPGITNVMARNAVDMMDTVDEIQINFAAFRCPAPAPGLLITFLYEFHPNIEERVYFENGKYVQVGPFEGLKTVNFPGPIGEQEVCYIPHEETWTMPKSLGVRAVSVRGCFPPHAMRLAKAMLESGLYRDEPVNVKGMETTAFELMHDILLQLPEMKETPLWAYGLVVDVIGEKDGQPMKIKQWNRHPPMEVWGGKAAYYKNIAVPLSVGAQMIARGDIDMRGILPPELVINPGIFFSELEKRGITIKQKIV